MEGEKERTCLTVRILNFANPILNMHHGDGCVIINQITDSHRVRHASPVHSCLPRNYLAKTQLNLNLQFCRGSCFVISELSSFYSTLEMLLVGCDARVDSTGGFDLYPNANVAKQ